MDMKDFKIKKFSKNSTNYNSNSNDQVYWLGQNSGQSNKKSFHLCQSKKKSQSSNIPANEINTI